MRRPERKGMRLAGHNYSSPGRYFVTICTQNRLPLFAERSFKRIVEDAWLALRRQPGLALDAFVVMPDHVHGVLVIPESPAARGIPQFVQVFKRVAALRINTLRASRSSRVWQRGYWDKIIREDAELARIRRYIADNPLYPHGPESEPWEEIAVLPRALGNRVRQEGLAR